MKPNPNLGRRKFLAATSLSIAVDSLVRAAQSGSSTVKLAKDGGEKAVPVPMPKPKRWGDPELAQLAEAVKQPSLYYWNNQQTKLLTQRFQDFYPHKFVQPCSSGSAALHIATAAAGISPGDEVITSGITDIGTVIGTIFQNAVPVFAELDPLTYNLDPADVERKITPKTKAIIAVHLSGNPCRMTELKELALRHNLVLIEDCAQGWGARYQGQPLSTIGHIGCFSLQDTKQISCGDGGIVTTSDPKYGPLLIKFGDKATNRLDPKDSSNAIACNYRMSELQAAFAATQLARMEGIADARSKLGLFLTRELEDVVAITTPKVDEKDRCVHWSYMCRLVLSKVRCSRTEFVKALAAEGVSFSDGYIKTAIYGMPMFQQHSFFAGRWPIKELGLTKMDYREVNLPVTEEILKTCMRFPLNEAMDEDYLRLVAKAVRKVAAHYSV